MALTKEQQKALHAKSTSHQDRLKLLGQTSGKMGIKSTEFTMFGGKVVTPSEKIKLQKQKEGKQQAQKEKEK